MAGQVPEIALNRDRQAGREWQDRFFRERGMIISRDEERNEHASRLQQP